MPVSPSVESRSAESEKPVPTLDPGALRAALERQQSELAPIGRVLAAVAAIPPRIRAEDWRGPAARSCERLEQRLARELRDADAALESARRDIRSALHELGG